jgi:hypothetical protein
MAEVSSLLIVGRTHDTRFIQRSYFWCSLRERERERERERLTEGYCFAVVTLEVLNVLRLGCSSVYVTIIIAFKTKLLFVSGGYSEMELLRLL